MGASEFKVMCIVAVAAIAAAALLAGCVRSGSNTTSFASVTSLPSPHSVPAFDDEYPDELPVSVLPDAEDAAARAVAMTGEVVRAGLTTRGDLIRTFATPEFAPKLLSQTNTQLRRMTADFVKRGISAEDVQVIETPITVDATVGEGFVIAWVWSVTVMVAPGMGTARQIWRTVQVELVREHDQWLVNDWLVTAGPTPVPDPSATFDPATAFETLMKAERPLRLGAS